MDVTAIAEEVKLFPAGKIPDSIFFQSSRSSFDTLSVAELRNEVQSVTLNARRRDKEIETGAMIIPGTCFRCIFLLFVKPICTVVLMQKC